MDVGRLTRSTDWVVYHLKTTTSTNDDAARLRDGGATARTAVVADAQTHGRGRDGRPFVSPTGGLYVSLLLDADQAALPGDLVALASVASAEAAEAAADVHVVLKWPNDLWVGTHKVGGILLEVASAARPVVVGIGMNLTGVPRDLPETVRAETTALDLEAEAPVDREALLEQLLLRVDAWQARIAATGGPEALEAAWRSRLVLIGEPVSCRVGGETVEGVLEDVGLREGLLIRDAVSGPVWRRAEHVQDLRPADRTIG